MRCDTKTFAQMYETVYKDLYRFALCMMRNPQDAEDAVSEAVVAAYENIGMRSRAGYSRFCPISARRNGAMRRRKAAIPLRGNCLRLLVRRQIWGWL